MSFRHGGFDLTVRTEGDLEIAIVAGRLQSGADRIAVKGQTRIDPARLRAIAEAALPEGRPVRGDDLERAMAMAIVDAAGSIETLAARVSNFVEDEALTIVAVDTERLRAVEATRVDMETF